MDAPEVVELLTERDFVGYAAWDGMIVILDNANRSDAKRVAHLQTARKACSHVDIKHFREKVLANDERNGRYWWARNSKVAEQGLGAILCSESKVLLGRT
jgi:hypothetical protein